MKSIIRSFGVSVVVLALTFGTGAASISHAGFVPAPPNTWVYVGGGCWGLLEGWEVSDPPYTADNPPYRIPVYSAYVCE